MQEGTHRVMQQALAAAQAERERHERTKERLERTEKRLSDVVTERHRIERELRDQLRPLGGTRFGCRLSYATFSNLKVLKRNLSQWLFFDSIEAFDAYAALLDSYAPMEKIPFPNDKRSRLAALRAMNMRRPTGKARGRKRELTPRDALVLWFFVARTGMTLERTADLFAISRPSAAVYFVAMTQYQKRILQLEFPRLTPAQLKASIPQRFQEFTETLGISTDICHIVDAFEKQMECPSDDEVRAACWSSYKHLYTCKWLLSMTASGAMEWVSDGYGGRITDPEQVEVSGFLDLLDKGCDVMVDKGFLIQEMVQRKGCICWMPPKMARGQEEATAEESDETSIVARLRIFVEQGVRSIKEWGWFNCQVALKISQLHLHGDMVFILSMLQNYRVGRVPDV